MRNEMMKLESLFRRLLNHRPVKEQHRSNGNRSGLYGDKFENLRSVVAVMNHLLSKGFLTATGQGKTRLDQWQAELRSIANVPNDHGSLHGGKLFYLEVIMFPI